MSKKPNERQQNCRNSFCYTGEHHDETHCKLRPKNADNPYGYETVSNEDCDCCDKFQSKFIQYPLTIQGLDIQPIESNQDKIGKPVRIRPCAKEYKDKTYLGIYLGDLPYGITGYFSHIDEKLHIMAANNPAIYVFELQKIIHGYESWWSIIESPEEIKDITDNTIKNQWYVKAAHFLDSKEEL